MTSTIVKRSAGWIAAHPDVFESFVVMRGKTQVVAAGSSTRISGYVELLTIGSDQTYWHADVDANASLTLRPFG